MNIEDKILVSISGLGYSGSGAVKDLLQEYDDVCVGGNGREFQVLYFPDGIDDLDYHLNKSVNRFYSSDIAIVRFIKLIELLEAEYDGEYIGRLMPMAQKYIQSITALKWYSYWAYDRLQDKGEAVRKAIAHDDNVTAYNAKIAKFRRLTHIHIPYRKYLDWDKLYDKRGMYLSIRPDNFITATREFLLDMIGLSVDDEAKYVLLDQFLPPNDPKHYYKYFETGKIKTVVVDRDPRDVYIFSILKNVTFIPHDTVGDFIVWYRENMKPEAIVVDEDVLRLHFEDLIYNYDETVKHIETYLGVGNNQRKKTKFNPDVSICNTQLEREYPQFSMEVECIRKELSEFLYDFTTCVKTASSKNVF